MNTGCRESESFSCCSSATPVPAAGRVTSSSNCSNITFVHANPANFRELVQKLTGAADDGAAKLPVASASKPPPPASKRQKLQGRLRAPAKLEILRDPIGSRCGVHCCNYYPASFGCRSVQCCNVSSLPVSIVDSTSPLARSSSSAGTEDEEMEVKRAIAEKGFYLHASSRNSGAANAERPKLLPLFPLHSNSSSSSSTESSSY